MTSAQMTDQVVYTYIRDFIGDRGYAPSNREIAAGCYISNGSVTRHLDRLELKRHIRRTPGQARSIQITDQQKTDGAATPSVDDDMRL